MKNIIQAIFAGLITIMLVSVCAWVFHSKSSYPKMHDFYEYSDDYDVWYLGSSQAIMSTLPEEMYNEYEIRSYNLACYGQTLAMDYWISKNLLKVTRPKLIVIDVGRVASEEKYSESNISSVRKMVSSLPFGLEKIAMINDLFEGDLREEMLIPFAADHYNWEYLTEDYFKLNESFSLGSDQNVFGGRGKEDYVLVTPTVMPSSIPQYDGNSDSKESLNCTYMRKLIELCIENDIEVLLVKCPLSTSEDSLKNYAKAFAVGKEYGVPCFDGFCASAGYYDGDTDMWDEGHLNSLGARKYTHLLGEYISENYPGVLDTVSEETEKRWNERYDKYLLWLDTELPMQSDFYSYLMLCTHPQYNATVEIKEGSAVLDDVVAMKFLKMISDGETAFFEDERGYEVRVCVYNMDGVIADEGTFTFNSETSEAYVRKDR